eukprot:GHVU01189019.1.p1 GENE.GHVU01189019.1~~GHVU01189019.1.p1  ORF type:complete len:147 (+),score=0.68 GHVU01189019.1:245-685(+)
MASLLAIEIPYLRRVMFAEYCFNFLKLDHSDHDILVGVLDSSTGKPLDLVPRRLLLDAAAETGKRLFAIFLYVDLSQSDRGLTELIGIDGIINLNWVWQLCVLKTVQIYTNMPLSSDYDPCNKKRHIRRQSRPRIREFPSSYEGSH